MPTGYLLFAKIPLSIPFSELAIKPMTSPAEIPPELLAWASMDPIAFRKAFDEAFEAHVEEVWQRLLKQSEEEIPCQH
jgi:hypothetical protein